MCNFNSYNRIVIKIGSALLADSKGKIDHSFLTRLAEDVEWLKKKNKDVLIVSSGAIAVGRKNIALSTDLTLAESQAYLNHLDKTNEMLGSILNSFHNIYYYQSLMNEIRLSIESDSFAKFIKDFYNKRHLDVPKHLI